MDIYTMDRDYVKTAEIDAFESAIWTERYYGDDEFELYVPPTMEMIQLLAPGTFVGLVGSDIPMIAEAFEIENEQLKVTGISQLSWMDNRPIRISANHEDRYWNISGMKPGEILAHVVQMMLTPDSPYTSGVTDIGLGDASTLIIPHLTISFYDSSGSDIDVAIPFGPLYTPLKELATGYQIGMKMFMDIDNPFGNFLLFESYSGKDRTSDQTVFPTVKFSKDMDSLTNIKELHSIKDYKTIVHSFAPSNPDGLATTTGLAAVPDAASLTGFDMKVLMTFEEDITTDMVGGSSATLNSILQQRAFKALGQTPFVKLIDGEIVPTQEVVYGQDYNLGDIVELEGYSSAVSKARVTEYIRSKDPAGRREYPTLTFLDDS